MIKEPACLNKKIVVEHVDQLFLAGMAYAASNKEDHDLHFYNVTDHVLVAKNVLSTYLHTADHRHKGEEGLEKQGHD